MLGTNNNGAEIKDVTDTLKYFSVDLMDIVAHIYNNGSDTKDVGASYYHNTVRQNNNAVSTKYKGAGIKDVGYTTKKKGARLNNVGDSLNYLVRITGNHQQGHYNKPLHAMHYLEAFV
ncbi:MAG: hypothetical protein JEZ14_02275 [Marinilabiliaceae bacterium]|nr:hypothetical protein [Marinilabiliaceae bacterium]